MAGVITNGIKEIRIGGVQLGLTEEDSFSIVTDDNTTTVNFNVEEQFDPIYSTQSGSKTMGFEFTIANPDQDAIETLFDGTVAGSDVELAGVSHLLREVQFEVDSMMGWGFYVPKANISSRFSDAMGKNSLLGIVVSVTIVGGLTVVGDSGGNGGSGTGD